MSLQSGWSVASKSLCSRVRLVGSVGLTVGALAIAGGQVQAAPYASGVSISGTTVNFILNEPADALSYSINGGAAVALDPTTKGMKSFMLTAPTDTFSITASKNAATGYTIPTGGTVSYDVAPDDTPDFRNHGLFRDSPEAGLNIISDETSPLLRFFSPRGVAVSKDPNAPNFGNFYVTNTVAGVNAESGRATEIGVYALKADGADAYGYGDTAQNPTVEGFPAFINNAASAYRTFVAGDGSVYVTDWSDANGQLYRFEPDVDAAVNVFPAWGGASALPAGQNHGSIPAVYVEGSSTTGDLTIYTIDEDLTTASLTGSGSTSDKNSVWRYDIGSGALPTSVVPARMNDVLLSGPNADLTRGPDGKWYLTQFRAQSAGSTTLYVLSPDFSTVLYNSFQDTLAIEDPDPTWDILQYAHGVAVSPNQDWLAMILSGSDVALIPLVDGIPQLEQRVVINTQDGIQTTGRDIDFDAAGNIYYVSSATSHERVRVLAPGGETTTTLSWNGTAFDFTLDTGGGPGEDDADFDGDGDVDGDDFLTWQQGLGPGDQPDGDANGDNVVDGADLDVWEMQFGQGAAAPVAGAVPEPGTCGLALLAGSACLATALRRRR